ncbi:helix-turn-helix transcriptional regulator [Inhella sp.]|uniref:helix-turn-helix transcriptional regulator n=1 Tax=Inhella sp. TaxID=1921806 RepID=UPI0035B00B8E
MSKTLDVRPSSFISSITCDRCSASAQHSEHEFEHFISVSISAGWGSPLEDGSLVEIDLCHACVVATLGPWLRFSLQGWAKPMHMDGLLASVEDVAVTRDVAIPLGSTNVYADLGYRDAASMKRKSRLVMELGRRIDARRLSQTEASHLLGIEVDVLTSIRRGRFGRVSERRLSELLDRLGN